MPPDTQRDFFDDEEDAVMSEQEEEVQEELVDEDTPDLEVLPANQDEYVPEISGSYSQKRLELTREVSPVLTKRVKLERRYTSLKPEEEDELMQWYRDNELLYNKKLSSFRNRTRKTEVKEAQAKKMDKTVEVLENWMLNMRTRYAKLIDDKSGMATREMTERDQWIYNSFDFLRPHIVRCPTRTSKKLVSVARPTQEGSQTSAPVSVPVPPHVSLPGSASTSASAEIDDPPPPPPPEQEVLQDRLDRAISMQQELMKTQRPKDLPLAARLIRDAHTFADTYLANATEDIARAYSLEVIKLATGFVDFANKQSNFRPKVQLVPPLDPMASTSLSFSPLLQQQQQPRHHQLQRSSWGGQTPSYGRPAATPVAERQVAEEVSYSFLRDVNFDTGPL